MEYKWHFLQTIKPEKVKDACAFNINLEFLPREKYYINMQGYNMKYVP